MFAEKFKRQLPLHIMLLPAVILVIVYNYGPMFGLVMAFQDFNPAEGFLKSEWVGLGNFSYLMKVGDIHQVLWNTVYISVMKITAETLAAIALALLLNELRHRAYKRVVQTVIYFPHFLSWIILGGIFRELLAYDGIVNNVLGHMGVSPVIFLGDNKVFPFVLVATHVWQQAGFGIIVYLAAISGINPQLYEAAVMDGAGRLAQIRHITLPGIKSIIILMATLSLGSILDAGFGQVYALYGPAVYKSGDIIDTWVYRMGLLDAQYSIAAAVDMFKSVVSFVLISISYFMAYKFSDYHIF